MYSSIVRVQNVFSFFTSISFFTAIAIALSTLLFPSSPTATISIRNANVRTGRPNHHATKSQEYAMVSFDLTADLTSLFNYNTKQVFAYLALSYNYPPPEDAYETTPSKWSDNDVIIWDAIIPSASEAKFHIPKEQARYKINDISGKFLERNATVRLGWNVQPRVGALYWGQIEAPLDELDKDELSQAEKGQGGGYGDPEDWEFDFPPPWKKKKANTVTMREPAAETPVA